MRSYQPHTFGRESTPTLLLSIQPEVLVQHQNLTKQISSKLYSQPNNYKPIAVTHTCETTHFLGNGRVKPVYDLVLFIVKFYALIWSIKDAHSNCITAWTYKALIDHIFKKMNQPDQEQFIHALIHQSTLILHIQLSITLCGFSTS